MTNWILPLALMAVLILATAVLAIFALVRAGIAFKAAVEFPEEAVLEAKGRIAALEATIESLRLEITASAARQQPAPVPVRPAMNLNKRSQALQLHRRGDPPEAIAATLGLPVQEVDLLIKVHRIILASI